MKFTRFLALSLTVVVLLAIGAVGFADKTEELLLKSPSQSGTTPPGATGSDHQNHSSGEEPEGSLQENDQMNMGDNSEHSGQNADMMDSNSGGEHSGH